MKDLEEVLMWVLWFLVTRFKIQSGIKLLFVIVSKTIELLSLVLYLEELAHLDFL